VSLHAPLAGRARIAVVAIAAVIGVGALFGGYGLLSDAEGLGVKESWLDGTPFPDYRVPGLVLLVVVGGGMLLTAASALFRSRFAGLAALAMGLTLLVWGVVETITIGYRGGAQLVLLAVFVVAPALPLIKIGWDSRRASLGKARVDGAMTGSPTCVDLYWLPLGAGGHSVRFNGRVFEAVAARLQHRSASDLFHSALEVRLAAGGRFTIEQAPVPDARGAERGVVAEGAVGARWAARLRIFRYEVRRWRDGVIPDVDEAVESPVRLTEDAGVAQRLWNEVPRIPTPVWGRDELDAGEMWNSNSIIAWLITRSRLPIEQIQPPSRAARPLPPLSAPPEPRRSSGPSRPGRSHRGRAARSRSRRPPGRRAGGRRARPPR
jgi:hypothetical protein